MKTSTQFMILLGVLFASGLAIAWVTSPPKMPLPLPPPDVTSLAPREISCNQVNAANRSPSLAPLTQVVARCEGLNLLLGPPERAPAGAPPPSALAGIRVVVGGQPTPLIEVGRDHLTYMIPASLRSSQGLEKFEIFRGQERLVSQEIKLASGSLGLFSVRGDGTGPASGSVMSASGIRTPLADPASGTPTPIMLKKRGQRLILLGTGFPDAKDLQQLELKIGDVRAPIQKLDWLPDGVCSIELAIPPGLRPGEAPIQARFSGGTSNAVTVTFK